MANSIWRDGEDFGRKSKWGFGTEFLLMSECACMKTGQNSELMPYMVSRKLTTGWVDATVKPTSNNRVYSVAQS